MADRDAARRPDASALDTLLARVARRDWVVGVVGLGYVGLPLAVTACKAGFPVLGFDIDPERVARISRGEEVIRHIPMEALAEAGAAGRFAATADFARLAEADAIVIAVPTPLSRQHEPDLSYVEATADAIARTLRPGQLVVLESTTWPGTTEEVLRPRLERGGLKSGVDFFLAFSPEREDPGNREFSTATIPKDRRRRRAGGAGARDRVLRRARREHRAGLLHRDGGSGEADGEHLPRGQHRARERVEARLRRDGHRRLGGHRGGEDEAVRLHAVLSWARARRPLHPDRPVLPHLESAGVRRRDPLHRAGGADQHRDALPRGGPPRRSARSARRERASPGRASC